MKWFAIMFSLFCIGAVLAADGDLQFAEFEQCQLEGGDTIANCRIGYRTYGTLNADRSNTVLMPTWFVGRSEDHFNYEFIGEDKMIDSSIFFVVSVDALSNGVSSSPSHGAEGTYPDITIGDMVDSQHRLLTEVLDIQHLHAVVGISMGGMQTFEWVVRYPDFMDNAVPNTGTPKQTAQDIVLWETEQNTIAALGNTAEAADIIAGIDLLAGYTPEYIASTINASETDAFIEQSASENRKIGLTDRVPQLRAMIAHDVSAAFGGDLEATIGNVEAKMLIVVSPTDHAVNPDPSREFAKALGADLIEYDGSCGHVDSICSRDWLAPTVRDFLTNN